jgi:hypothetical protein
MKKIIFGLFLGVCLTSSMMVLANDLSIKLIVNGKNISSDVPSQNINGRVMIPARAIAESLGAKVEWDGINRTVIISSKTDVENNVTDNVYKNANNTIKTETIDNTKNTTDNVVDDVYKMSNQNKDNTTDPTQPNNNTTDNGVKIYEKDGYTAAIKDGVEYYEIAWVNAQIYSKQYAMSYNLENRT